MPQNQNAKAVADALEAGAGIRTLVDTLYAEIGNIDRAAIFDIGPGPDGYLVALPGYGPLREPADYVKLGRLMN